MKVVLGSDPSPKRQTICTLSIDLPAYHAFHTCIFEISSGAWDYTLTEFFPQVNLGNFAGRKWKIRSLTKKQLK